ncbi:MAG: hypothetical protein ACYCU0_01960 [Solirubrobacteraceae bacterium]
MCRSRFLATGIGCIAPEHVALSADSCVADTDATSRLGDGNAHVE